MYFRLSKNRKPSKSRYEIELWQKAGKGATEIAVEIGRDKSVVSRELRRNSDLRSGIYRAKLAERKILARHADKNKAQKFDGEVEANILHYLDMDFSPEQMVGKAKIEGKRMVSIESIYRYVWQDKRNGGILYKKLRTQGKKYGKRSHLKDNRGLISGRVDIDR